MFLLFLIPFGVVLGAVMLARNEVPAAPSAPALMSGSGGAGPRAPSPIAVLCVFLRKNQRPPQIVIECAIAEAQLIGRDDLVDDLVRVFVKPALANDRVEPTPASTEAPIAHEEAQDEAPQQTAAQVDAVLETARVPLQPEQVHVNTASPIDNIPDDAWSRLCGQLVREAPTFTSQRHVGRYRHRKDRLAEIGFDPDALIGSPDAQDAALTADLADAYKHVVASGMAQEHVGRVISIPDVDGSIPVTMSGVLGLASVAGLEGAAGWLESKPDRKKFPHTTMAFLRTNGVF